jgi:Flp pilus assembly protein TadG
VKRTRLRLSKVLVRALSLGRTKRDESGVLTAYVALLAVALLAIVGMAVDSGRAIAAQGLASGEAEQAARAGAGQLSVQGLRDGQLYLDPSAAVKAAEAYTLLSGHPGTATVSNGIVTVRVVVVVPTTILDIVGVQNIIVSATASASDVSGVTEQN